MDHLNFLRGSRKPEIAGCPCPTTASWVPHKTVLDGLFSPKHPWRGWRGIFKIPKTALRTWARLDVELHKLGIGTISKLQTTHTQQADKFFWPLKCNGLCDDGQPKTRRSRRRARVRRGQGNKQVAPSTPPLASTTPHTCIRQGLKKKKNIRSQTLFFFQPCPQYNGHRLGSAQYKLSNCFWMRRGGEGSGQRTVQPH